MEFDNEEDKFRYEKGQYYICLLAILNMVEMIVISSVNSGQGFFIVIPFQLCLNIGLYIGKMNCYKIYKYFGFCIGAIGAYGVIYHLITPHVWTLSATTFFLINLYIVIYSAWSMYLIRKDYIVYYVETKSAAHN